MNLLRIEHTYGQIGIEVQRSQVQLQNKLPKVNLQHTNAKIQIDKKDPKVKIDQHECFATAGLKNVFELTDEAAQEGIQQATEYAAKKASEGDALANIKGKGKGSAVIAEIARSNTFSQHEFNIDNIPKARPKIEIEGYINISVDEGKVEGQVDEGRTDINFTEPKINMYLKQQPSLNIQYVGNNIDESV